jgi:archaellum biogenesis ATPase FlaH
VILGGTNVGKSLFLCHAAAANLAKGYNVLYITLEMSQEEIAKRIDQNLLNVTTDDLMLLQKDVYIKKMERLKSNVKGKLIVKEYPTASAGASHFRHLLSELKIKKNFKPAIIYIDYLNICVSSRLKFGGAINSYSYVKAIAEELRGLAVEGDVPIFTATQTNRTGFTSSDVGLEDTSECIAVDQSITLVDGTEKKIGDVKIGDQIIANDGFKTTMVVHHKKIKECVKITTKSGKSIIVSKDHSFPCVSDGVIKRISVNNGLKEGDVLNTYNPK